MTRKFFLACIVLFSVAACNTTTQEPKVISVESATEASISKDTDTDTDPTIELASAEFNIEGMTCAMGCAKVIENKLANLKGVKSAVVDFDTKRAKVAYNQDIVNPELLSNTVTGVSKNYSVHDLKTVQK